MRLRDFVCLSNFMLRHMAIWETAAVGDLTIGKQGFNRKKSIKIIITVFRKYCAFISGCLSSRGGCG
jgi:hypothetical protein